MSTPLPDLASRLPRELVAELLSLARAGGAEFAEVYGEHAIQSGFSLDESRLKTASYSVLQGVGVRAIRGEHRNAEAEARLGRCLACVRESSHAESSCNGALHA